jgi:triacylglycerol lipase
LRKFVEAVLVYTGAKQVNIISHGMGVTIARKVVKGGYGQDHQSGYYDLGASLQKYVKSFIGIAGYNMGLISCAAGGVTPFCGKIDGFFPGNIAGTGLSEYLADLNLHGGAEGTNVWTAWSQDDEKIGPGSIVYNKITCRIPGQNGEIKKTTSEWTHYYIRDNIGRDILPLL